MAEKDADIWTLCHLLGWKKYENLIFVIFYVGKSCFRIISFGIPYSIRNLLLRASHNKQYVKQRGSGCVIINGM